MKEEGVLKILSIDGGGIKGLYSAKVLEHFESEYSGHISDHFDLLCGTSTGGIIALALSLKVPAKDIVQFYKQDGPVIFKYRSKFSRALAFGKQLLLKSKYPAGDLKTALEKVFKDARIKDAQNLLCIPSFNVSTGENRVFKYDHTVLRADNELRMVDVALATSAAPTYFPLHQLNNAYYTDGGIWANNPAMCGLLEAFKYFVGPNKQYSSFKILSVSSLNHSNGFQIDKKWYNVFNYKRMSYRKWGSKLFQVTLDGQSEFVDFFLTSIAPNLNPKGDFVRIPSYTVSPENIACISLDKATKKALELLEIYGDKQGLLHRTKPDIKDFFKDRKTIKLR